MASDQDLYNELAFYTLSHPSQAFIHQHAVDAFAAQHADERSKPIATVFALIGLYLHIEKGFSGKQVQKAHMQLATRRKQWPRLEPPEERGATGVSAVLAAPPGEERDEMIRAWCVAVWNAWKVTQGQIRELVKQELGIA
jgi:hypothetical protein